MRDLQIMSAVVGLCVVGVLVSLGGGIYTAVERHRVESQPHLEAFPVPATMSQPGDAPAASAGGAHGDHGLPTPAH